MDLLKIHERAVTKECHEMGKKKRKSIPTTQPKDKNLGGNCGTISAHDLRTHSKARMDSTMMSRAHGDFGYNRRKAKAEVKREIDTYIK